MFNSSVIASIMNVTADVFHQQNVQDPKTGAISRQWVYAETIQCKVEPIKSRGTSIKGDSKSFNTSNNAQGGYNENLLLKIKTLKLLSKRWRIENIRSSDGQQVYIEPDKYDEPDTIFEVIASHAVLDPFGKVSYFEATLQRASSQTNDPTVG